MRSIPTEENPALRASRYAVRTSSTEWIRPEGGERFRPERLDPEAHAVEAALPQPGEIVAGHRPRVRLRRDLGVFRHGKARPDRGEEPVEPARPEDRRRPPAEVHGVRRDARFAGELPQEEVHLPLHERGIPVALLLPAGDGVEVAIPALADAERNVNVDPPHRAILRQRRLTGNARIGMVRRSRRRRGGAPLPE